MVEYLWNFCVKRTCDKLSHLTAVSVSDSKPSVCFSLSLMPLCVSRPQCSEITRKLCTNECLFEATSEGWRTDNRGRKTNRLPLLCNPAPTYLQVLYTIQGQYVGFSVIYCYGCSVADNQPLRSCPHRNILRLKQ